MSGQLVVSRSDYIADLVSELREAECVRECDVLWELVCYRDRIEAMMVSPTYTARRSMLLERGKCERPAESLSQLPAPARTGRAVDGNRQYRITNAEVTWSMRPQVLVLAALMSAVADECGIFSEADMLATMEENRAILATRQPVKILWSFYKGAGGFIEHGNIEVVR